MLRHLFRGANEREEQTGVNNIDFYPAPWLGSMLILVGRIKGKLVASADASQVPWRIGSDGRV